MKNQELLEKIDQFNRLAICGYGELGRYIEDFVREKRPDKDVIIADNSLKNKTKEIILVDEACKILENTAFLLTTRTNNTMLMHQLINNGVPARQIMDALTEEAKDFLFQKRYEIKTNPLRRIQFEVDIVSHCNLNCKSCSQFSPISKEEYIDCEEMERDFQRLGKLFRGECERIYLIGGEPLLHQKIEECIRISRKHFAKGKISVFTNGLLLLKKDGEFWKALRKNDVGLIVTKYPIAQNYKAMFERAQKESVSIEYFNTTEDFKYMTNLGLDPDGLQDIKRSFALCTESNNCIKLRHGRLYTCTRPAVIRRFNEFFGLNLETSEKDSIDIYQCQTGEEILRFLATPIEFCKYCNFDYKSATEWGVTKKELSEWL